MRQAVRLSLLCAALLMFAAPAAMAQLSAGPPGAESKAKKDADTPEPPPPAIPGAEPSLDLVAPPSKPAAEMNPNDALFDSISRGDLAAARDAVNRGADLNARNVLGQSPLDSSIDLNRSDITFLLMSLRPSSTTPGGSEDGQADAQAQQAATGRPTKLAKAKPVRARRPVQTASVAPRSGDGGTPNPAAGFLGFGK